MDIKNGLDFKYKRYSLLNTLNDNRYRYEEHGLLVKCLPKILFKSSPLLVSFLQLVDMKIILLLKYIDRLKKFKYIALYK